jgi:hypothetical protein
MALNLENPMSEGDPNSAHDVMNATMQDGALMRRLRELEQKVAGYEAAQGSNVVRPFAGEAPRYRLNESVYFDDTLFEPGTEIEFIDCPNLSMVPLNEPAKRAMDDYIEHLTSCQREKEEGAGREFRGLITDRGVMIAQGLQDARREARGPTVAVPQDRGFVPSMPHTPEAQAMAKRGPGRPRKVVAATPPPQPGRPGPKPGEAGAVGPGVEPRIFRDAG